VREKAEVVFLGQCGGECQGGMVRTDGKHQASGGHCAFGCHSVRLGDFSSDA
jgi:hypothetical protein